VHYSNPLELKVVNDTGTILRKFYDVRQIAIIQEHGSTKAHIAVYNADCILPECAPADEANRRALTAWELANGRKPA
jgi:hypothetical protein